MKKLLKSKIFISIISLFVVIFIAYVVFEDTEDYDYASCNVIGVEMKGQLFTYINFDKDGNKLEGQEDTVSGEDIIDKLYKAEQMDNIKAIIFEVDSAGGSPSASEEIDMVIKKLNKPVISYIRELGSSAAYYSISNSDRIFALKSSNVGGIGVTQSYLDNVSKNQKDGLSFVQLSTGKYKDAGNPDKKLTQEERNIFMRDSEILYNNFIKTVSEGRGLTIDKVKEIADGSTVLGEKALDLKLIDEIGNYDNAVEYIESKIGEQADVCW